MAEKKPAKSSYVVRTDQVIASTGKPHFYGEKVKLSDEEAKPLFEGRQGVLGVKRTLRRYLRPAPGVKRMPELRENPWQTVVRTGRSTPLPVLDIEHGYVPPWYEGPYRQDVPKWTRFCSRLFLQADATAADKRAGRPTKRPALIPFAHAGFGGYSWSESCRAAIAARRSSTRA